MNNEYEVIPKKIHYIWFGSSELPENVHRCIESWKEFCPDYEINRWDDSNYDTNAVPFVREAIENKKFAFASDYARLDIINKYGGFYLDTDVELLKSLDELRKHKTVMACELEGRVSTGIGFGSVPNSEILQENMKLYQNIHFDVDGQLNLKTCVDYTTDLLSKHGLTDKNIVQFLDGVVVLPPEYLCPYNMETSKLTITEQTIAIHHFDATWYSSNKFIRDFNKHLLPLKVRLRHVIDRTFGMGTYEKLKMKL